MSFCFQSSITKLERLPIAELHKVSLRSRANLGSAEWHMSACLLAWNRRREFHHLGYSSLNEYAEKALQMSGQKVWVLLAAAKALEHLPLMADAFRAGKLCWAKIRVLQGVVTPETEATWLEYAQTHRSDQVARKVTMSPREWKKQRALESSLSGNPVASAAEVARHLVGATQGAQSQDGPTRPATSPSPGRVGPSKIRVVIEMSPDQYAFLEAAERLIVAREGKRLNRAAVITRMAEATLDGISSKARAKHQVLIHTTDSGDIAWYETKRGNLPVDPEILRRAKPDAKPSNKAQAGRKAASGENLSTTPRAKPSKAARPAKRQAVPVQVLRALLARASGRCERCGATDELDVHHETPVSEGGTNNLESLRLWCKACHSLDHQEDFASKPHWGQARMKARRQRLEKTRRNKREQEAHCEDTLVPYKQQRKFRREYETIYKYEILPIEHRKGPKNQARPESKLTLDSDTS